MCSGLDQSLRPAFFFYSLINRGALVPPPRIYSYASGNACSTMSIGAITESRHKMMQSFMFRRPWTKALHQLEYQSFLLWPWMALAMHDGRRSVTVCFKTDVCRGDRVWQLHGQVVTLAFSIINKKINMNDSRSSDIISCEKYFKQTLHAKFGGDRR